jgi:hypothetical protein
MSCILVRSTASVKRGLRVRGLPVDASGLQRQHGQRKRHRASLETSPGSLQPHRTVRW